MQKLFGGILMAVGLIIGGLSGICTIGVIVSSLHDPSAMLAGGGGQWMSSAMLVLIVGGIPILAGVGLFLAGRKLVRSADAVQTAAEPVPADDEPKSQK